MEHGMHERMPKEFKKMKRPAMEGGESAKGTGRKTTKGRMQGLSLAGRKGAAGKRGGGY